MLKRKASEKKFLHCVECSAKLTGQQQKYCSNKCKQKHHYHRVKSQTNAYHSQTLRAWRRKLRLIQMMGGKCAHCGYNSNMAALHFHHKDSYQKSFKLDLRILSNRRWSVIVEEAKKCTLLCANCHLEAHNPELTMENVRKMVEENSTS